jgi:uncharacterized protein (UPF0548 family)
MFRFSKPDANTLSQFLARQRREHFSYKEVGSSREQAPAGYNVDHNRIQLGRGIDIYERSKRAIQNWKIFDIPWISLWKPDIPIEAGATVAVVVAHLGFWSMNAARIVYVVDEAAPIRKYGFAYGTLRDHGERGEERFTVELHPDESVWYDLYAFSRPSATARLAYPYTRSLQKRFASQSKMAMLRAASGKGLA